MKPKYYSIAIMLITVLLIAVLGLVFKLKFDQPMMLIEKIKLMGITDFKTLKNFNKALLFLDLLCILLLFFDKTRRVGFLFSAFNFFMYLFHAGYRRFVAKETCSCSIWLPIELNQYLMLYAGLLLLASTAFRLASKYNTLQISIK
ncbi:MAG: hypothetical protein KA313_06685 [Pseudarcicella sp.]|jgi:hypothetical protein|nr:hypothetical protein [Pseudarcicella sp.]MBP6410767.1 hypothetical protein [Pseudarcicella sp.]